jgi:hypothetical protein
MMKLWRLHIRPKGGHGNSAASVAFCLKESIIGMGWGVPSETITRSENLDWYKAAAARTYNGDTSWSSVTAFAGQAEIGDLVWFRNTEGRFYIAELLGSWQYAYEDAAAIEADIVNFRRAKITEVGVADAVPGKVIACFRPTKCFQPIRSEGMLAFTAKLANVAGPEAPITDLYEFMTDADLENVVFVYLQILGWYVLPGTRTATTAHYEFVLVNRETGTRAVVQVKSGGTSIDAARYAGEEKAFLFAASGIYGASIPPNAVVISRQELNTFMHDSPNLLPRAVSTWIGIAGLPRDHV